MRLGGDLRGAPTVLDGPPYLLRFDPRNGCEPRIQSKFKTAGRLLFVKHFGCLQSGHTMQEGPERNRSFPGLGQTGQASDLVDDKQKQLAVRTAFAQAESRQHQDFVQMTLLACKLDIGTRQYAPIIGRFRDYFIAEGRKGFPPEKIGEAVHVALTTARPKVRYAVVPQRLVNWTLPMLLPKRLLDKMIGKQVGLAGART